MLFPYGCLIPSLHGWPLFILVLRGLKLSFSPFFLVLPKTLGMGSLRGSFSLFLLFRFPRNLLPESTFVLSPYRKIPSPIQTMQ